MDLSQSGWRDLFQFASDGIFVLDKDWRIVAVNPKAESLCGRKRSEVEGRMICTEVFVCHDAEGRELCDTGCPKQKVFDGGKAGGPISVKVMHRDGSLAMVPGRGIFLPALGEEGALVPCAAIMIKDEEGERKLQETLIEQERRDPLTGLYHRQYFEELYGIELNRAKRHGGVMTLLMLDVGGVREINQRHGDAAGDRVLREVGRMVRQGVRGIDVVARFGGDEFVVLLHNVDEDRAKKVVQRLKKALETLNGSGTLPEAVSLRYSLETTDRDHDRLMDRTKEVIEQHRGQPL